MPPLRMATCILGAAIVTWSFGGSVTLAAATTSNMPAPLKVVRTRILNCSNQPVLLRGVNTASLEWTSDGQAHILQSVNTVFVKQAFSGTLPRYTPAVASATPSTTNVSNSLAGEPLPR